MTVSKIKTFFQAEVARTNLVRGTTYRLQPASVCFRLGVVLDESGYFKNKRPGSKPHTGSQ